MKNAFPLILFCIFTFAMSNTISAQNHPAMKKYLLPCGTMFLSGMLDGTTESISFHYCGFKKVFSNANDAFWNPELSWKNKYKNSNQCEGERFPGSTTIFVCTTDGYHLLRMAKRAMDTFTVTYYFNLDRKNDKPFKKEWKKDALDFCLFTMIKCVGFNLTYGFLFRQQPGLSFKIKI